MNIANNILNYSLRNVYFLTGTACAGKTTMTKMLCEKHGFIHFNDNWHEDNFTIWQSIIDEKYQPKSAKRKIVTDWESWFSRSLEEFLTEQNDDNGGDEQLQYSLMELIKLSQNNKVVADIWFPDVSLLTEISDYNRIACLLAPAEMIIRDYYGREDHKEFIECIMSLNEPEKKIETQNQLFRIGAKISFDDAEKYKFFKIIRSEDSTVQNTLKLLENHFGL